MLPDLGWWGCVDFYQPPHVEQISQYLPSDESY